MKSIPSRKISIIISFLLHLIVFGLLFVHFTPTKTKSVDNVQIVNAVAVNESQLTQLSTTPKTSSPPQEPDVVKAKPLTEKTIRRIEQIALKETETTPLPIAKSLNVAQEPVPKNEPDPIPLPKKETLSKPPVTQKSPLALQEPLLEDKLAQKKLEDEKLKQVAEEKRQKQVEEKKQQDAKRQAELKQQEEALAKKQQEEESKQLQQELAQAKQTKDEPVSADDSEASADKAKESDISEQLNAEKGQLSAAKTANTQADEIDKYKNLIIQTISRKWLMPDTEDKNLACQVMVHLGPGGVVINVDIIKESGDSNLDRSARNAILKASPLPVPESSELFDNFRSLRLTFRPQGIVTG